MLITIARLILDSGSQSEVSCVFVLTGFEAAAFLTSAAVIEQPEKVTCDKSTLSWRASARIAGVALTLECVAELVIEKAVLETIFSDCSILPTTVPVSVGISFGSGSPSKPINGFPVLILSFPPPNNFSIVGSNGAGTSTSAFAVSIATMG